MKLFSLIAAAAVVGTSLIAQDIPEAKNGWMFQGHHHGTPVYWRFSGCQGNICKVEINTPTLFSVVQLQYLAA